MTGNIEIGIYLSCSVLLPSLNYGMTFTVPVCNEREIKYAKCATKTIAEPFI